MPLYEYLCKDCTKTCDEVFSIADRRLMIECPHCGGEATRIIGSNIQRVEPTWLDDAKRQLQPDSRDQIRDRNDLARHMKQEGIEQIG